MATRIPELGSMAAASSIPTIRAQAPNTNINSILAGAIPGLPGLTQSATNIIGQSLNGMPATSRSRNAAAYYGAAGGVPGSQFANRLGYDLYNREADASRERGMKDLLSYLSTYGGLTLNARGQDIGQAQFNANLEQQQAEFAAKLAQEQERLNRELMKYGYNPGRYTGSTAPMPKTSIGWGLDAPLADRL